VEIVVDGWYLENLHVGWRFDIALVALTEGWAAARQAVVGGRLPLAKAHELSGPVLVDDALTAPDLVRDIAIGQSTVATRAVVANHHDASASGSRLVYGGYSIRLALHQAVRALLNILTVVGLHCCDCLAAVGEGDTLMGALTQRSIRSYFGLEADSPICDHRSALGLTAPSQPTSSTRAPRLLWPMWVGDHGYR
jgi:hypothetical protein